MSADLKFAGAAVRRGIGLRTIIQQLLDELVPAPHSAEDVHARMFGLADALTYELADRLLQEMAGGCEPAYVERRLRDYFESMLLPFTLTAIEERRAALPPTPERPQ